MREITGHKVNACNEALTVHALDATGIGGAPVAYLISGIDLIAHPAVAEIRAGCGKGDGVEVFHTGPVSETEAPNGITHEVLLAILIDRFECFQAGPFACHGNEVALAHLKSARDALAERTRARRERGVEGTHAV